MALCFKIVNLVSTRPRVSKLEFFVALALVALAQTGKGTWKLHTRSNRYLYLSAILTLFPSSFPLESTIISTISTDVSVEQVALLAQQNTLPEPTLDLSLLSYIPAPPSSLSAAYTNNQRPGATQNSTSNGSAAVATAAVRSTTASATPAAAVMVAPPPDDPWMTGARYGGAAAGASPFGAGAGGVNGGDGSVAPPSSVAGSGLPSGWWKRQEKVAVQFSGQQGFVLNRYMVYGISTEVRRRPVELSLIMPDFPTSFCVWISAWW